MLVDLFEIIEKQPFRFIRPSSGAANKLRQTTHTLSLLILALIEFLEVFFG